MSIDVTQFYQSFFEESFEGLDTMEACLVDFEASTADVERINTVFRAVHSIKGGSGTFGFDQVTHFAHVVETLLDEIRSGQRQITPEVTEVLLQSVDCLRAMLTAVCDGAEIDQQRVQALQEQCVQLSHAAPGPRTASGTEPELAQSGQDELAPSGWHILFQPLPHMLRAGTEPLRLFRELKTLGELTVTVDASRLPPLATLDPEVCYLAWELTLRGDVTHERLSDILAWFEGDCTLTITPLGQERVPTSTAAPASASQHTTTMVSEEHQQQDVTAPPSPGTQDDYRPEAEQHSERGRPRRAERRSGTLTPASSSIRVSIEKIDELINMVGELVITQAMLHQVGEHFDMSRLDRLRDGLDQLERNTRAIQESVMRIRMLPIQFTFSRFPRLVHDLCQQLGKQVELSISGEHTELDKTVLEKIGDPLVHLIRNALDHGIENPHVRRKAGKPEIGVLHLHAYHQGGRIVIEISDDGAGLDKEKLLRKAKEQGLIVDDEVLADEKVYDLIFHPGFSTSETVSDVSGRGVGMDVVQRNVAELGGRIEVRSEVGRGTTFTISLPLTLAILDGQLVRVGQHIYIIPLVSIIESLNIEPHQVKSIAKQAEVYRVFDHYVPVIYLRDVLYQTGDDTDSTGTILVLVEGYGHRVGLVVDDLLGQQQVVIKSLESNFRRVEGISGATILGDGRVALILDIVGLIDLSQRNLSQRNLSKASPWCTPQVVSATV
jgi:two-component system chemotaxis sensor kinase CheA